MGLPESSCLSPCVLGPACHRALNALPPVAPGVQPAALSVPDSKSWVECLIRKFQGMCKEGCKSDSNHQTHQWGTPKQHHTSIAKLPKEKASDADSVTFILWLFLNLCRREQNNPKHSFCPPSQLWLPCPSAVPWELPLLSLHLLPSCISIGITETLALRVSYCSRVFNCNRKLLRMKKLLWQEVWAVCWKQSRLGTRTVLDMNFNSDLQ